MAYNMRTLLNFPYKSFGLFVFIVSLSIKMLTLDSSVLRVEVFSLFKLEMVTKNHQERSSAEKLGVSPSVRTNSETRKKSFNKTISPPLSLYKTLKREDPNDRECPKSRTIGTRDVGSTHVGDTHVSIPYVSPELMRDHHLR